MGVGRGGRRDSPMSNDSQVTSSNVRNVRDPIGQQKTVRRANPSRWSGYEGVVGSLVTCLAFSERS